MEKKSLTKQWKEMWNRCEEEELSLDEFRRMRLVGLITTCFPEGGKVLDLGGGSGILASELKAKGHEVTVVDCSPAALAIASSRGHDVLQYDLQDIDYEDWEADSYDAVVVSHLLDVVSEPCAVLRLTDLVLRPGGFGALVVTRSPEGSVDEAWPGHRPFFDNEWLPMIDHGFDRPTRAEKDLPGQESIVYVGEPPEQTLALCLLMWNEAPFMRKCMESVPYDELIIGVDDSSCDASESGETDPSMFVEDSATYKIAKEYVDKTGMNSQVYVFPHMIAGTESYDFSARRNEGFGKATADWIIQVDGHEFLRSNIAELLDAMKWAGEKEIFHIWMHRTGQAFHLPKMWRNNGTYYYENPVHNILGRVDDEIIRAEMRYMLRSVHCDHMWTDSKADERAEQRDVGNIPGLLNEAFANPKSERPWFFIGNAYMTNHRFDPAYECYEKVLEMTDENDEAMGEVRYQCLLFQGKMNIVKGKLEEAKKKFLMAIVENSERCENYVYLADVAGRQQQWGEAKRWASMATHFDMPLSPMFLEEDMYGFETYDRLSVFNLKLQDPRESFDMLKRAIDLMDMQSYMELKPQVIGRFIQLENMIDGEILT